MLVLLAGLFVVHIATAIMLFVSTIANVWMVADGIDASVGLWKNCTSGSCDGSLSYGNEDAIKAVQAFMILSIIFSIISLVVFVFQLFTMEKGNRFFLSGSTMLVCWLCILIGVSIYTHHYAHSEGRVGEAQTQTISGGGAGFSTAKRPSLEESCWLLC